MGGRGSFSLTLVEQDGTIQSLVELEGEGRMFPFLNPRSADMMLGLAIGLTLALAYHWVAWVIH